MPTIELSLDQRRALWSNYQKTLDLFGQDAQERLDQLLSVLPVTDIVEEFKIPLRNADGASVGLNGRKPWHKAAVPIGAARGYTFHRCGWEKRDYDCPCQAWLVPSQYQSLREGHIIHQLLLRNAPWLEGFATLVYGFSGHPEFYVTTEAAGPNKALYVPIGAFLARDVDAIVKRNETYWRGYYVGPRANEAEEVIAADLGSETTKRFFAALKGEQA